MAAVELMVLEFPDDRPDDRVVAALVDAVDQGQVVVLDLVYLARSEDGSVRVVDVDEELDQYGFGRLLVARTALLSADDLDVVREGMTPGTSALVVVYELAWSRRVVDAVGGRRSSPAPPR